MISLKEKICYGLGDFGCNIVFATVSTWFIPFCISIGISLEQAGLILFLSKFIDAICDLSLGIIIDNDQNNIKKLMKISIIPLAISFLLLFVVPFFPEYSRLLIVFCLFNLSNSIFYNFFNIPYASLNLAMTDNENDRYSLNIFRMVGSISCMLIINNIYPLIDNKFLLYIICTIIMIICFIFTIKGTTIANDNIEKTPIDLKYFKDVFSNKFFWLSIIIFFAINFKLNVTMYSIGITENINPGLATLFFMVPSIPIMLILSKIHFTDKSKYFVLLCAFTIDILIQIFNINPLVKYLLYGIITFPIMSSMIYNLFSLVNKDIYDNKKANIKGIILAITGIMSNLCTGFMGLCLNIHWNLKILLLAISIIGLFCILLILKFLSKNNSTN